jgi:hypothetical protein
MPPVQAYTPLVKSHGVPALGHVAATAFGRISSNVREAAIATIASVYTAARKNRFNFPFIALTC